LNVVPRTTFFFLCLAALTAVGLGPSANRLCVTEKRLITGGVVSFGGAGVAVGHVASRVTENSASVAAGIVPNARATTWFVEFGRTAAYGGRTAVRSLGAGVTAVGVSAALAKLRPHTRNHYRFVATNADGTTLGADATFVTHPFRGVQVVKRALRVTRRGDLPVVVACTAGTTGSCAGTLTLATRRSGKSRAITLARVRVKIAAGARRTVHLRLGSRARGRVRHAGRRGLRVTLTAVVKDANGVSAKTTVAGTLRRVGR
jgi:hypothetical protein